MAAVISGNLLLPLANAENGGAMNQSSNKSVEWQVQKIAQKWIDSRNPIDGFR